jgi:menaquinone-dependent protoporphyrinogen oxidase
LNAPEILVLYATHDGQSRKIAGFIADHLGAASCRVRLVDLGAEAAPEPGSFAATILVAPLRVGRYPQAVIAYARHHCLALGQQSAALVSVSLSAASTAESDQAGLARCLTAFCRRTGWTPGEIHHAAGAFRFSRYGFFTRWAMTYIAWRKGQATDRRRDYELTDWAALQRFVEAFRGKVG